MFGCYKFTKKIQALLTVYLLFENLQYKVTPNLWAFRAFAGTLFITLDGWIVNG
jgi:hypothetical protein